MTRRKQGAIVYYAGLAVSVISPFIAALTQFPVWTHSVPKSRLGGMFIFTALLCCIPFLKHIRMQLKTPSAVTVWAVLFLICWSMNKIIDQLYLIALVGLAANVVGAIMCAIGNRLRKTPINNNQYNNKEKTDNEEI
ncbi:MAG: hypothetical protein OSJ74_00015 [Clostridia bacterium]|nr:hypothetical protein [Clostridia bacterium]